MSMNTGTFSIPDRWQKGVYQIKSWIEHYAQKVDQPLEATIGGETDSGHIWITDRGTLTDQQYAAAENAVHILNDLINRPKGEPWKARFDADMELEKRLAEIDIIFSVPEPPT